MLETGEMIDVGRLKPKPDLYAIQEEIFFIYEPVYLYVY